jgi:hypothetical protein
MLDVVDIGRFWNQVCGASLEDPGALWSRWALFIQD